MHTDMVGCVACRHVGVATMTAGSKSSAVSGQPHGTGLIWSHLNAVKCDKSCFLGAFWYLHFKAGGACVAVSGECATIIGVNIWKCCCYSEEHFVCCINSTDLAIFKKKKKKDSYCRFSLLSPCPGFVFSAVLQTRAWKSQHINGCLSVGSA